MPDPYPHQERIFELLAQGKNVILQAPTGSGKTRAALDPFISAFAGHTETTGTFPRKCIYSVPMRVLANQFHYDYSEIIASQDLDLRLSIQTGEQPTDPDFKADLVFATIDQTLSSFLLSPYGLSRRKANLNAAAVMGAYLVFDEFHLFDPISTLPTTLQMLQMLKGIAPFVLMTATFSSSMLEGLAKTLDAEVVPSSDAERERFKDLPSQRKTRRYHVATQSLTAEAVLREHQTRSIVVCNTVERARALYELLCTTKDADVEVLLLHSRFLPEDRKATEEVIRTRFGKADTSRGSLILVSTQAIEVGLDITSTRLHTELAPANAIIQRAGRCARYEGNEGDVFIYRQVIEAGALVDLCERVNPYANQEREFLLTYEEFGKYSGDTLDFSSEQDVISAVHGARDERIIAGLRSGEYGHRAQMFAVMRGDRDVSAQQLIREVFQQCVTIHNNPDVLLYSPFDAPAFGVHPGTMRRYVADWLRRADELQLDWAAKVLVELNAEKDPFQVIEPDERYRWESVTTAKDIHGAALLVVHPELATYDKELGFLPDRGGEWQSELPEKQARSEHSDYTYQLETYERHIELVYHSAFDPDAGFWNELDNAASRLERRYGWAAGSVKRAAQIAVVLHDVGKLSRGWQGWVREYQKKIGLPVRVGEAYAHTDLHTADHRAIERGMKSRPPHAVESSVACLPMLADLFADNLALGCAVYSAIARHHSPYAEKNQAFRLEQDAQVHVWASIPAECNSIIQSAQLRDDDIEADPEWARDTIVKLSDGTPEEMGAFQAYCLLVRVLRRADQLGTELGAKS